MKQKNKFQSSLKSLESVSKNSAVLLSSRTDYYNINP